MAKKKAPKSPKREMTIWELRELAAKGAEIEINELLARIAMLRQEFNLKEPKPEPAEAASTGNERGKKKRRQHVMSDEERMAVSIRMKKYWASRRKGKGAKKKAK